ncbi:dTMP kinase [Aerococcus vaginalis]
MKAHDQYPGYFITLEGPDGSGKTTLLNGIVPKLQEQLTVSLITTREPGGVRIAEAIRDVILDKANTAMDVRTEALLYAASRRQHLAEKVIPALERGEVILSDRFVDSSVAYQGFGRDIGAQEIIDINQFATDGLEPDLTLTCMLSAEEGIARIQANRDESDQNRLDHEAIAFHKKVVSGYEYLLDQEPARIHAIDAMQTPEAMQAEALAILKAQLAPLWKG